MKLNGWLQSIRGESRDKSARGCARRRYARPIRYTVIEALESRIVLSAPDLVAFAQAMSDSGVIFYGAAWCPHCTAQKQLFEDGASSLPFVEVTNPDRSLNATGLGENITSFPTWEFPDGSRAIGVQSLAALSQRSGVAIPVGGVPRFAELPDVTLSAGSPLHISLDGYDPDGQTLTYEAFAESTLVDMSLLEGNDGLRVSVAGYGDMNFQLFDDRAPRVTSRIKELAEAGFYDDVVFHRVIDNFVIQGGDPTGTGSGGSDLGDFDDQFHVELQHNQTGLLSMAKSSDDTNDSQFFVTEGAQRHLDFNHSIFGVLVEGEAVRDAISEIATDAEARPLFDVVMQSVRVFEDDENAVLVLQAPHGMTGEADVTVIVEDADGNEFEQTFHVTVVLDVTPAAQLPSNGIDPRNSPPFLEDIPLLQTLADTPFTFPLHAVDVENNPAFYLDERLLAANGLDVPAPAHADLFYAVNVNTGLVSVTPLNGLSGTQSITVATAVTTLAADYQVVPIQIVASAAPLAISASDHLTSDAADDGRPDTFELFRSGTQLAVRINGVTAALAVADSVSVITINGSGDDDMLIVDFSTGNPLPSGGLVFHGTGEANAGGDALLIRGGTANSVEHTFQDSSDGTVNIDGSLLTYAGLNSIADRLGVADRAFRFSGAADEIRLSDNLVMADGLSRIASAATSETVDFANPTESLTIHAGGGNDTVTVFGADFLFGAALTIDGDAGHDELDSSRFVRDVTLRGADGDDGLISGTGRDSLDGGSGNDTLTAGTGDDIIHGGTGADLIVETGNVDFLLSDAVLLGRGNDALADVEIAALTGGAGDNALNSVGFSGSVTLNGGAGSDLLVSGAADDLLSGGAGDDLLNSGIGNDFLLGESGNDTLFGGDGQDVVIGGEGDDAVSGQEASGDVVSGGLGNDTLDGGAGSDTLVEFADVNFTLNDSQLLGLGIDVIRDLEFAQLTGGNTANVLDASAFSGATTLQGGLGADTLVGGPAADSLNGGGGDDFILAGAGNDLLDGSDGHDTLNGNSGDDAVKGGHGNDKLLGSSGRDSLDGGDGDDFVNGQGSSLDTLSGGVGNDTIDGGAGIDLLVENGDVNFVLTDTQLTGLGVDQLIDSAGERVFLYGGDSNNVIDASAFSGNVTLNGSLGNDTLRGGANDDALFGGAGRDLLIGGDRHDVLRGQGSSNDTLTGGNGDDILDGSEGFDLVEETGDVNFLLTVDRLTGRGTDRLIRVERVRLIGGPGNNRLDAAASLLEVVLAGGMGNDVLIGGAAADRLFGDDGADTLNGGAGSDFLTGDAGDDLLTGGEGDNSLVGGAGNDSLIGGEGRDGLSGSSGDDFLNAHGGDDSLIGGDGNDTLLGSSGQDIALGGLGNDLVDGQGGSHDTLAGGNGAGSDGSDRVVGLATEIDEAFSIDLIAPFPDWAF